MDAAAEKKKTDRYNRIWDQLAYEFIEAAKNEVLNTDFNSY